MSVVEMQELEEVKGLIAKGQQVGVLTYAEIATATADLGLEEGDVEELHGLFERCEIERLHPQVGTAIEKPNVEYPWRGRNSQGLETWLVPASHDFGLLSRMRRSLGTQLISFLEVLIERFDQVF